MTSPVSSVMFRFPTASLSKLRDLFLEEENGLNLIQVNTTFLCTSYNNVLCRIADKRLESSVSCHRFILVVTAPSHFQMNRIFIILSYTVPFWMSGCESVYSFISVYLFIALSISNSMHLDINISLHTNLFFCLHMSKSACLSVYLSVTSHPALLFNFTYTYGAPLLHGLLVDLDRRAHV